MSAPDHSNVAPSSPYPTSAFHPASKSVLLTWVVSGLDPESSTRDHCTVSFRAVFTFVRVGSRLLQCSLLLIVPYYVLVQDFALGKSWSRYPRPVRGIISDLRVKSYSVRHTFSSPQCVVVSLLRLITSCPIHLLLIDSHPCPPSFLDTTSPSSANGRQQRTPWRCS